MITKVWHGAVGISSRPCDECGKTASVLFPLENGSDGCWVCRACVLDPAADAIGVIDRRGVSLHTREQVENELDARTAIFLHLESREHASHPGIDYGALPKSTALPFDYVHVLAVLQRLARADDEFSTTIAELRERYETAACFSPKQILLVQWRLAKHGIEHEPSNFVVSVRTEKEVAQLRCFDDWRRQKIAPYLSWQQRSRFGI
jgi:hypothetical protein